MNCICSLNICNPFDIQQTFDRKIHLLHWETENTGKGGRWVKHREGVDLVRYEVHLHICLFCLFAVFLRILTFFRIGRYVSIQYCLNMRNFLLHYMTPPCVSCRPPSDQELVVWGRPLPGGCWGCSRESPSHFRPHSSASLSQPREVGRWVRSHSREASQPPWSAFFRSCLQRTWTWRI